jgi:uncharacterized FlaG/YvyC family protein
VKIEHIASEIGVASRTGQRPPARKIEGESAKPSHSLGWIETTAGDRPVAEATLDDFKRLINGLGLGLAFSENPENGQPVITVFDSHTGAIIRQIPPQEIQAILRQVRSNKALSTGLLVSRHL